MIRRVEGRVAIVTGGSRGIGQAIALRFVWGGARTVIVSRDATRGARAAAEMRAASAASEADVDFIAADVTDSEAVQRMVAAVLERHGRIDVLVNNAGIHDGAPFAEETEDLWVRMFRGNVLAAVFPSQAIVPHMMARRSGAIVHIASKAGVVGEPGHAAYSASKGAIIALTRAMAIELAEFGIRVNAVCPGPVATDMLLGAVPAEADRAALAAVTPLRRLGHPEDIAGIVLHLASEEAGWCTGQALSVDGGLSVLK